MTRVGEVAVEIVQMKNDLGDTAEALVEDKKFLADTIKVLNDDDALELFKKTLPGSASFVELSVTSNTVRGRALAALRSAPRSVHIDFIALAIQGRKIGFEKVIKMIDEMVVTLKTEQEDDDHKKA